MVIILELSPLSKDASFVLYQIYKEYLIAIQGGISKSDARKLGSGEEIYQRLFSEKYHEDYLDEMRELGKKKYLKNKWASNKIFSSQLTFEAIEFCESRFKRELKSGIETLNTFKNFFMN